MRFFLCAAALCCCSVASAQDRLVESFHVIYRDASDDYLFRARMNYDVESVASPDLAISFWIYGERPLDGRLDTLAIVADWYVHDATPAVLYTTQIQSYQFSATPLVLMDGSQLSFIVPRSDIVQAGDTIDLLFPFHISAGLRDGSESYQYGIPYPAFAQLNVPEPSSMAIAAGIFLLAVPLAIRGFRRRRPQDQ